MHSEGANPFTPPTADPRGSVGVAPGIAPDEMLQELRGTRPWVQFVSVISFIGIGFIVLAALGGLVMSTSVPNAAAIAIVYLGMAAVSLWPTIAMYRYGSTIAEALVSRSAADVTRALSHQRLYWKAFGILMIISIAMFVLGMIVMFALVAAGISAFR